MSKRVAIGFSNTLGNLMFLSTAVKVLRKWGYNSIDLLTDKGVMNRRDSAVEVYGSTVFDSIVTKYDKSKYEKLFLAGWSVPASAKDYINESQTEIKIVNWSNSGTHEVQLYLAMVGAGFEDFDGYIFPLADKPILGSKKRLRIALANASGTEQARKKRWDKFPELSKRLEELGFEVVLVGLKDELKGCVGTDFTGKLSIYETGKVIQQCDLLIASSTGLTVVADAVKTPVILLEGPMFTVRAHPLQSRYTIVRRFISCAPCFQTPMWNMCNVPHCMNMIEVEDVVKKVFSFIFNPTKGKYIWNTNFSDPKNMNVSEEAKQTKIRLGYLIPCCDRYYTFRRFFDSLVKSKLPEGVMFIHNDGSTDPRIKDFLNTVKIPGVEIIVSETPFSHNKYKECKIASTRVNNILIKKLLKYDKDKKLDYMMFIDSDVIVKPYWAQMLALTFREASKRHKLWGASALNPSFDKFVPSVSDKSTYETKYSKYRMRGGLCINYLIDMKFLRSEFGFFDQSSRSSDISKSTELFSRGYAGMILVPAMMEHIGVLDSSFRARVGVYSKDF